jgi:hypothetical protein
MFLVQAYQISPYAVPRGGIFLGKWRSSFAGNSDGKLQARPTNTSLNRAYENGLGVDSTTTTSTLPHEFSEHHIP